uniref:Glucosaminyl (N-acetyl) transferase 1 n=1 Tax=Lepisosteus oculatus TaxID=7918 RepID=W5NLY4_LEPOC|nr:PREDICTED: beta-1,3-galactosyl-O-glycosyl-glycoprotein beta-1,6-N-acetylglucosaminyltransferase [Lepisosteus oculatus]XP_015221795.1 PREDICTED: beta-1,3-galactosyl-O-glycosyl-glycoprotein beta-1,6-N-acetylglucosaminyltransferase [Lepisosteus oculatus]XP_015221803.1 PREDICTED: beta-1,3-galactosyl-O-glycosyl-glycoprotein beta-1,6-N-acetylglucosaminyltransferase [Lepisosteus oculatus]
MSLRRLIFQYRRKKLLLTGFFLLTTLCIFHIQIKEAVEEYKRLELINEDSETNFNCTKIIQGDVEEIGRARLQVITVGFKNKPRLTNDHFIELTKNCENFRKARKYITFSLSKEEKEFPIAYSLVVHHKIDTFERLLRSIYAPQNVYCIHVDKKSPVSFLVAVKGIASCFDNVFVASQLESVIYASWGRVQADINCMKDLYRHSSSWKYFINLCGMDFPIKTNLEIVGMLKALNGKNSLETEKMPPNKEMRWKKHYEIVDGHIKKTNYNKDPPPIETPVFSGGAYIVVSRDFVQHVLEEQKILNFIEWTKDTYSPDELLWATLQRIPVVPGSIPVGSKYDVTDMNAIARFVKWSYFEGVLSKGALYPPCTGTHVRSICVYGAGDLNWILQQHHLFANKFDIDVDPFAIQCLEEHLRHKSLTAAAIQIFGKFKMW